LRSPLVELVVGSTWDGRSIAAEELVRVRLSLTAGDLRIVVSAPFHGDPPPPGVPGPTDRLWEHEVVELFVAGEDDRYTEVELSPWGHHLVLRLHGVRRVVGVELPLAFRARRCGARWVGVARLDRELLPDPPWRANAYAIHGNGATRRYLAATPMPGERPDFHQPDRFPLLPLVPSE
jgi:hypothetical protein